MKSVVVEIKNGFAALLSDDGRIVKVKNKNYVIGQVIEMKIQKVHITKKLALSVASAAVILLSTSVGAWAYATPYSYVSLDVNPSIEYTLNRFERVIDVKAVNDDGQVILDQIDIKGLTNQSIEDAIIDTVEQISQDGYFGENVNTVTGSAIEVGTETDSTPNVSVVTGSAISSNEKGSAVVIDGGIVITISNNNGQISEELVNEIRETVEDFVTDNIEVEVSSVGYERVQRARELGVTPGKLNLVEKLQASSADPSSINLEEWLNKPVKDIMKAIKENKKANPIIQNDVTEETDELSIVGETEATSEAEAKSSKKQAKIEEKALKALEKQAKTEEKALEKQAKTEEKALEKKTKTEEKNNDKQEKQEEKTLKNKTKAENKAKKSEEKSNKGNNSASKNKTNSGKGNNKK